MRKSSLVMALGLAGAVGFALAYGTRDVGAAAQNAPVSTSQSHALDMQADFAEPGSGGPGPVDTNQALPPNHPAINGGSMGGAMGGGAMGGLQPDTDPVTLAWTAPKEWAAAPNPNPMRLATYKISGDTELVVARAGGDVATNVSRWSGQFDGSPAPKQTQKKVQDLDVTVVHFEGTYEGGMGTTAGSHPSWAMLGAIVQTKGESYFFKVIGPAATVKSAEKPFQAMIDGLKPS